MNIYIYTYEYIHICIYMYIREGRGFGYNVPLIQRSVCVTCARCLYVWHDFIPRCGRYSSMCVTWLGSVCVTWLVHMCDMTHAYMWHDSFIRVAHTHARTHTCTHTHTHKLSLSHTHTYAGSLQHLTRPKSRPFAPSHGRRCQQWECILYCNICLLCTFSKHLSSSVIYSHTLHQYNTFSHPQLIKYILTP